MIHVKQLVKKAGEQRILDGVSFSLEEGQMVGIIGPNGAGKSTLLSILSGVEPFQAGEVRLRDKKVDEYNRKSLARWLAVLRQEGLPSTSFSVREVVAMARFPYQNWLGDEEANSEAIIDHALEMMGLSSFAERRMDQLSGGERQRVALAKVMAQQPQLIFLDEPTTYLDIGFQVQLLDSVREWQQSNGLTVVAVLHDLNLAAQYCDRLVVLHEGKVAGLGTPLEVLTAENIRKVYGTEAIVMKHPVIGCPQVLLQPQRMHASKQKMEGGS
ncbi:heme ABC transporter ATP-binding protein [Paenibacillus abyssi]|uniref:ABC transporter ATP-binding protein n=1 Tax=Paenibacillus abyssi TaxID=1340531 RepID=A0A917D6Q1_9BACL|nr:heme ABC transporter ATP-binding protein [Paenibacillus abyssi]GGG11635.1 ABC transporter ATP-binding protein [Paenibacillus abyssi]